MVCIYHSSVSPDILPKFLAREDDCKSLLVSERILTLCRVHHTTVISYQSLCSTWLNLCEYFPNTSFAYISCWHERFSVCAAAIIAAFTNLLFDSINALSQSNDQINLLSSYVSSLRDFAMCAKLETCFL